MSYAATFLSGANADFIAELYARFRHDPASVDPSWSSFFDALGDEERAILSELRGASWSKGPTRRVIGTEIAVAANANQPDRKAGKTDSAPLATDIASLRRATIDSIRALMLIRAYRIRGHLMANLDPLGLMAPGYHPDLDPKTYGFTDADNDRPIFIDNVLGFETATLRQILDAVHTTYCGTIGAEYMHIQDPAQRQWIQERMESARNFQFTPEERQQILSRITAAEGLEKFLAIKKSSTKRFGIEGGETLIPVIEEVIAHGTTLGLREVVVGMAHRGRLNVLTNVLNKPYAALFSEFQGNSAYPDSVHGSGDVKYHLGTSNDREFRGQMVHLTMNANPSHLEAVDPVVIGRVRAKQQQRNGGDPNLTDEVRDQVMGLLLHGDAAFAGQGLVAETLMLADLQGYATGGTIHIVINNQIGFTTSPAYARSGPYCTDVAKTIQAPILHVNGDDPDAALHVARIAIEFRQRFHRDVVIDMFCYRRHGHNESDEPAFTQPLMYKAIRDLPTTRALYAKRLAADGVLSAEASEGLYNTFLAKLETDYQASESYKPNKADWLEGKWSGLEAAAAGESSLGKTAAGANLLQEVGRAISTVPAGWDINPKIVRQLQAKAQMMQTGEGIDWATAEALAFGTLCAEGYPVRLSGQDSGRGTFSQRHSVLHDQTTDKRYIPLNHVREGQASYDVHDSPLSEAAVFGFEYGFSTTEPRALVLWEAQFGDFANGAQVLIDQFLAAGESKWLRMSGLVLLLPHGYEGQGAEHSSARLERYLQLCAENNMQVANCSTPANYFHILRRQIHRSFRKPLILMTPKSLLRHKLCVSPLADLGPDSAFHPVLPESEKLADAKIRRVVLCSGKVYYDLLEARIAQGIKDVALVRVEELYPFPAKLLGEQLAHYPKADIVWCQEEPENMGAWRFIDRRIEAVLTETGHKTKRPLYVGRPESAAPATGLLKHHNEEQAKLVKDALGG